jgi:hypothetical protein
MFYLAQRQEDQAIEALRKEIAYHPESGRGNALLAFILRRAGRTDEAVATLRDWTEAAPKSIEAATALSDELMSAKRYDQAADSLKVAITINPADRRLGVQLLTALLRAGKRDEGLAFLKALREQDLNPEQQGNVAYVLADTNTEPVLAQELAEKAVAGLEQQSSQAVLSSITTQDLRGVLILGAAWDTLGWSYFRNGDLNRAEKFLRASWLLTQETEVAEHLKQLAVKQGRKQPEMTAGDLSQLRSTPIPDVTQKTGSAEFFLLLSPKGVLETRFISGDEGLKTAGTALQKASFNVSFPDDGPERIIRRGILSCSQYTTPSCNFILFLPSETRATP